MSDKNKTQKITRREKILLHIYTHKDLLERGITPYEVTQKGIIEKLGLLQPDVSKILCEFVRNGLVRKKVAYIDSVGKKMTIYVLTGHGINEARAVIQKLKDREVDLGVIFPVDNLIKGIGTAIDVLYIIDGKSDFCLKTILELELRLLNYYFENNNYADAMHHASNAVKIAIKLGDKYAMAKIYTYMGRCYMGLGNYVTALQILNRAFEIGKKLQNEALMGEADRVSSAVLWHMGKGIENVENLSVILNKVSNRALKAEIALTIAVIFLRYGYFEESYSWFRQARQYMGSTSKKRNPYFYVRYYNNLGMLQRYMGRYKAALQSFEKVLSLSYEINHYKGLCYGYINAAFCHIALGNLEKAARLNTNGKNLLKKYGNFSLEMGAEINRALIYVGKGLNYKGIEILNKCIERANANNDAYLEGLATLYVAEIERKKGWNNRALEKYKKALKIFKKNGWEGWCQKIKKEMEAIALPRPS